MNPNADDVARLALSYVSLAFEPLKNRLNVIWKSVLGFFEGDKAKTEAWFKTSNPMLGGTSPLIMIQNGRVGKLERFVTDALQENQLP